MQNHVFLFGSKQGVPFAEVYLGNGPVSSALKELCKTHRKSGTLHHSIEGEIILRFPAPVMADFVSKIEGPFVMYNKNLTPAIAAETIRRETHVSWSFWVHQDQAGEENKKEG